jgi:hypothetical protein
MPSNVLEALVLGGPERVSVVVSSSSSSSQCFIDENCAMLVGKSLLAVATSTALLLLLLRRGRRASTTDACKPLPTNIQRATTVDGRGRRPDPLGGSVHHGAGA